MRINILKEFDMYNVVTKTTRITKTRLTLLEPL